MNIRKLCWSISLGLFTVTAVAETLVVNVSGIKPGEGDLRIGLFNTEKSFPYGEWAVGVEVPGTEESMRIEVTEVPAGQYAVSVVQDLNGNGKLDKNFVGMPKEPYGFSGDWKSGAASFDDAAIQIGPGETETSIKMK
ncbi:MAG: DUF2141 domain-containing protein [bacterium]